MNTYTVQKGDTLQSIAEDLFGDSSLANYLASINNIPARDLCPPPLFCIRGGLYYDIKPGQELITEVAEVEAPLKLTYIWIGLAVIIAVFAYLYFK